VAFGHPVWFEDSMSEESGSLTSTKVARHRNKALDHLEGKTFNLLMGCLLYQHSSGR
jgi:hypothetical protein